MNQLNDFDLFHYSTTGTTVMRGVYYREASNTNVKAQRAYMRQAGIPATFWKILWDK